ncbi:MAG: NAD(P)-dependent alcohol dehydrogenase [Hyphomonadaceae bacterium]
MKAAVYDRYGPPEVVRIAEVEKPAPKANEILVRVFATTVCAADWRFRKADPFIIRLIKRPRILGIEFAGRVEAVGAEVTRFAPGDDVFGASGFKFGAHAEYLCVPQDGVVERKPVNMSHEEAAAVMFGAVSALHFLRKANIQPGQNVLVYGASGSVGVFAVQLAKHYGARVTGVCSTANLNLVRSLGADDVVDYTREDFSAAGPVYDVIIDTVGKSGFTRASRALKRGGAFLEVLFSGATPAWMWVAFTGRAKVIGGVAEERPGDAVMLKQLIEAGELRTVVDRRYPLEQIAEAHRLAESGHKKGHVVVTMAS